MIRVLCVVGRPVVVDGQRVLDPAAHQRVAQALARGVAAHDAGHHRLAAQRAHVAGHVGGAAEVEGLRR